MSGDDGPARKRRRCGTYLGDGELDAYIDHLIRHGGHERSRHQRLVSTGMSQVVWYGDLDRSEIEALGAYRRLFFIMNTDNPTEARATGGSHWFLVVLCHQEGQWWALVLDSSRAPRTSLPCNENTIRNLGWLVGEADVRYRKVPCPVQAETECGLCALANMEFLYRWQSWEPGDVDLSACPIDHLRESYQNFRDATRRDADWFFTKWKSTNVTPPRSLVQGP